MMNMKEEIKNGRINKGLEVAEIGNTLQWTMTNGQTCIQWFDDNGQWVRSEWVG